MDAVVIGSIITVAFSAVIAIYLIIKGIKLMNSSKSED